MFGLDLFKISRMLNLSIKRNLWEHKWLRYRRGLHDPPLTFKPGEESIDEMPDEETRAWKEQRSLYKLDKWEPGKVGKRSNPIDRRPQMRGIVLRTLIKKPKKPNSANRKCVLVRLSNGKEAACFVPGIGHNLQEHSNVLVRFHRVKDVPGLKLRVIRGVYDCSPILKQSHK